MTYRRQNEQCANCGSESIPTTKIRQEGREVWVTCASCGIELLVGFATETDGVNVNRHINTQTRDACQRAHITESVDFSIAEAWATEEHSDMYYHGKPALREAPDKFYEFVDAIRERL